jgi:hypothetical protein
MIRESVKSQSHGCMVRQHDPAIVYTPEAEYQRPDIRVPQRTIVRLTNVDEHDVRNSETDAQ